MSPERAGMLICCFVILLAVCGSIVAHEVKKGPPRRPNVRVPPPSRDTDRSRDAGWWS